MTRPSIAISEGALDGETGSVEALAERLGITSRHLHRLFVRHWGASPSEVARTARVQRAKRLLDTTTLSILEIAFLSGFGSLRRLLRGLAPVPIWSAAELWRHLPE